MATLARRLNSAATARVAPIPSRSARENAQVGPSWVRGSCGSVAFAGACLARTGGWSDTGMTSVSNIARAMGVAAGISSLIAAGLHAVPPAAVASQPDFAAIDAHVQAAMQESAVPGIAYGIARDGEVLHLAAFGKAGPGERPMTPQTPVVIGSVGKSLTALAIRQLVEAGRIEMDEPVTRYLPWFRLAGPPGAGDAITIRALLDHTSGLSTADGQDPRWYVPGMVPEGVVRALATIRADRPAGSYEYSNLNYVVLGVIVEAVSGQAYGEYLRQHVFEPLGMQRSITNPDAAAALAPAEGHRYLFGVPVPFAEPYPTGMVAAGYQVSTAEDMAHYVAALSNRGVFGGVDVVSPPGAPPAGEELGTDWQALAGASAGNAPGQSGSTLTSNADIIEMPGAHLGVVVLMNANPTQLMNLPHGAANIALDVLRLSLGLPPAPPAPSVRIAYLVVDLALLVLVALLALHVARARNWLARVHGSAHPRFLAGRTLIADLLLPLVVLAGLPLLIGATGSSRSGDVIGGWTFLLWTLPDIGATLLALAAGALLVGALKLTMLVRSRGAIR